MLHYVDERAQRHRASARLSSPPRRFRQNDDNTFLLIKYQDIAGVHSFRLHIHRDSYFPAHLLLLQGLLGSFSALPGNDFIRRAMIISYKTATSSTRKNGDTNRMSYGTSIRRALTAANNLGCGIQKRRTGSAKQPSSALRGHRRVGMSA